ncbi:MAG TPA: hypothetical protein VN730_05510 [Steroidobacteraceae bacterium]|nr:hypothetical protein [Steroidobacteraceae bacterium]
MTAAVSLKNVVKRSSRGKQQVEVLHGLNLTLESGETPRQGSARRGRREGRRVSRVRSSPAAGRRKSVCAWQRPAA